jgi:hypothetical protein
MPCTLSVAESAIVLYCKIMIILCSRRQLSSDQAAREKSQAVLGTAAIRGCRIRPD